MSTQSAPSAPLEPATWQRMGVALVAVMFLIWPFLYAPAARTGGSQGAELVRDGRALVLGNPELTAMARGTGGFGALVTSDWWGGARPELSFYRPLSSALLGLGTVIVGEPYDPAQPKGGAIPFKLFSLALHAIAALLVIELGWRLFRKAPHAIAAGLLFVALPVHADLVLDAGGLALQLGAVFSLASLCVWFGGGRDARGPGVGGAAGAAVLALLGALSHEVAFLLVPVILVLEASRAREGSLATALGGALGRAGLLALPALGLALALGLRLAVGGNLLLAGDLVDPVANPLASAGFLERVLGGLRMAAAGLPAVLGLDPLASRIFGGSPDHSAAQVAALSAFSPANLLGVAALLGAVALTFALFPRCRTRGALFLAALVALVLGSNAVFVLPEAFSTRLLILPAALLALFAAPFLGRLGKPGLLAALVLALAGGAWLHGEARHWRTPTDLWRHVADNTARQSARAHTELGGLLLGELLHAMGKNSLERAVALAPQHAAAHALLAEAQAANFEGEAAAVSMRRAVELVAERSDWRFDPRRDEIAPSPSLLLWRVNQLEVVEGARAPEDHLAWLDGLIARGYDSPAVELYRARTLLDLGDETGAEAALRRSLEILPTVENVRSLGRLLLNTGRAEAALELYRTMTPKFEGRQNLEAELLLHQAGAELALAPQRALELANRILTEGTDLSAEQRFQANFVAAQALLDLGGDPVEMAGHKRRAAEHLTTGLVGYREINEDTYFAMHSLGLLLFAQGHYDRAEAVIRDVLTQREGASQRWMLGTILARTGKYEDAVRQLELARAGLTRGAEPVSMEIYMSASLERLAALAALSANEAAAEYPAALAEDRFPADREVAVRHLAAHGRADEALAIARAHVGENPRFAQLMPALERAQQLDRDDAAQPGNASLLAERSSLRLFLGNPAAALADARLAVDNTPAGPDRGARLVFLAQAQGALGATEDALATWQAAADDPQTPAQDMERIEREIAVLKALLGRG